MPESHGNVNQTDHSGKRTGCLIYTAGGVVVLALFLWLGVAGWYDEAKSRFESEAANIARRGEPLWFADLEPRAVPLDDDAAPLVVQAIAKLVKMPPGFYELLTADPPTPPGLYEVLESNLTANRPALDLLAQALGKPHCHFSYDYATHDTFGILLQHVQDCRELSRLLEADVLHSLAVGDRDRAAAAIAENLGLGELLHEDPFVISQLVRMAIAARAIHSLQTIMAHTTLTTEQFAALDERLDQMGATFTLRPAVVVDRAMVLTMMQHLDEILDPNAGIDAALAANFDAKRWHLRPALWREQAFMLRSLTEFADLVDKTGPEGIRAVAAFKDRYERDSAEFPLNRLIESVSFRFKPYVAAMRHRQRLNIARLAIRVGRYRAERGELPGSLDSVVDESLRPLLIDLFSDQPLVYRATAGGFIIYPVGEDRIDNGGGMKPDETEGTCRFEVQYPESAD